jgi:flagellar hook-length control protein FliK
MDFKRTNGKPDNKQDEEETKISNSEVSRVADGLLAAVSVLPMLTPVDQAKMANNLTPAGVIKGEGSLSFVRPSTGNAESNQSAKVVGDVLQGEAVFRQSTQDKQGFNLKYLENSGQAEKTLRVDGQALSVESEKTLPRVGLDIAPLDRMIVANKTDVPAMTKPLSHPEWSKDLGERIVWMNSRAIPAADIRLNPQHLGPISVRVDVADDRATVVFTAQNAAVREVIEASIPKLREMMSGQQLNLVDVTVSAGSASDQGRSQAQNFAQNFTGRHGQGVVDTAVDEVEQEIESGRALVSKGLLNIYA